MENNNNNSANYLERTNNAHTFVGSDVDIFALCAVASALKLYARTGMRVNRAYTATNMHLAAERYSGKKYKKDRERQWAFQAADDLKALADRLKAAPRSA